MCQVLRLPVLFQLKAAGMFSSDVHVKAVPDEKLWFYIDNLAVVRTCRREFWIKRLW